MAQNKWTEYLTQHEINKGDYPYPPESHITIYWAQIMKNIREKQKRQDG